MGRILEYLHIDSKEQPTDVLDAERLLEGMQKIYSNAADSKKKDNFGNLLAEMTKTFIEVVNGEKKSDIDTIEEVEQQQQEEQEIEDIESVESETESQQEGEQQQEQQEQQQEQEELLFKVGDKFKRQGSDTIFTIANIGGQIDGEEFDTVLVTYKEETGMSLIEQYNKEFLNEFFKRGKYYLVNEEEQLPFKVGDKFKMDGDIKVYTIENINNQEKLITISFPSIWESGINDFDDNLNNFKYKWDKGIFKKYDEQQPQSTPPQPSKPKVLSAEDKQRIKDIKLEIKGLQLLDDDEDAVQLIKELEEEMNMIKKS